MMAELQGRIEHLEQAVRDEEEELEAAEIAAEHRWTVALGPVLNKAASDPFEYVVGLKTGAVVHFESVLWEPGSEWILLEGVQDHTIRDPFIKKCVPEASGLYSFDRGIAVRLSEIMWAADAGGYNS